MDVAAWLRGLGLERYERAFRENEIDWDALPKLTADDLKDLGVVLGGHRRKLLDAIAALDAGAPGGAVTGAPRGVAAPAEAERRQLTVMFCDLVGSTALSTRHDPEDLRELIGDYHRAVAETVGRFDGFVAKYMGDGVLTYFGYPQAHEDDAERAVRAGLAVIEAVDKLPAREDLSVRLGVATGLAVVGDLIGEGAAQERGVVGETPNLAARLQALAAPNTLVIFDATRRQIGGLFDLEDLGPQQLAGFAGPQRAWRVLGESGAVSRFEALRSGATPLVGRDEEVDLLIRRWQQAKSGEGRIVLIAGEPGIGKSRLTAVLSEHLDGEQHTRLRYFCSPHHQDSAFHPFIAQLERAAGFARDDTAEAKLDKLQALLMPGTRDGDDIALLSELLSVPGTAAAGLNLSPRRKREKLFEALLGQLAAEARRRPVLMVFEDAHWIDPTTRELLDLTVDRVRHLPVLLVITFRPEFQPPWGGRSHVTSLALNRLGDCDGEALVQTLAGNAALTAEIIAEIVERTDGVPLFVEELTKAVLESAAQEDRVAAVLATTSLAALSVPATLHASLMARLDRLGPAPKEVAQIGAVLGREFAYELIEPVAQRPEVQLHAALDQLGEAGLLFCRGTAPHASYLFKHALVQDAAYSTLLRGRRQELHARVAAALEEHFADLVERQPELLAHHLTGADEAERAVDQWLKAGRHAIKRSANLEAISHLHKGIAALTTLPDTAERARRELVFQTTLGSALSVAKGQGAPEFGQTFARARELCQQVGETPEQLFPVLWGLWYFHLARAEMHKARDIAQQLLGVAENAADSALLLAAHRTLGQNLAFIGEFAAARTHLERAIALYDPQQHRSLAFLYGQDLGVLCRSWSCLVLWLLGFPDQALRQSSHALSLARELEHPYSLCYALNWAGMLHVYRRERHAVHERAEASFALAQEQGFAMWIASGPIWRGWVLAGGGEHGEGIALMHQGVAAWMATGGYLFRPYYLGLAAEAAGRAGHTDEALHLVVEALAAAQATGERFYEAELYRVNGDLLLKQAASEGSQAEAAFGHALDVARQQQAKSLELRAAASLARLWGEQGRRTEARDLLAPVYGWFTEGIDTADLKEAKALLDELGGA